VKPDFDDDDDLDDDESKTLFRKFLQREIANVGKYGLA
jgi:hypothetical protein